MTNAALAHRQRCPSRRERTTCIALVSQSKGSAKSCIACGGMFERIQSDVQCSDNHPKRITPGSCAEVIGTINSQVWIDRVEEVRPGKHPVVTTQTSLDILQKRRVARPNHKCVSAYHILIRVTKDQCKIGTGSVLSRAADTNPQKCWVR
jgi:hypothetical protein